MSKVLYWNIDNFDINKINNPSTDPVFGQGGLTENAASIYRRNLFLNHISRLDESKSTLAPDYIVVVGVVSPATGVGDLIPSSGGLQGCSWLLDYLRKNEPYSKQDWRMVPPLKIGNGTRTEAVAILYRGSDEDNGITRYFTGPNLYNGGANGISFRPGTGKSGAYQQGTFNDMIVPCGALPRTIPSDALYNKGVKENQVAARIKFLDKDKKDVNFGGQRQPLMATFTEVTSGKANRQVTIFACHAPEDTTLATKFMSNLIKCDVITSECGEKEVKVICGNFNLNLLNENGTDAGVYKGLIDKAYQLQLSTDTTNPPIGDDLKAYKGYFATRMMTPPTSGLTSASSLFLWSSEDSDSYYPGYGYIGDENDTGNYETPEMYSVDNMLVKYPDGADEDNTFSVVNTVVGIPMDALDDPPGNAPIGDDTFENDMLNLVSIPLWPDSPAAGLYDVSSAQILIGWRNYGHIYDTSSHFALYASV